MQTFIGTPIDEKNIGLAKLLYGLRQDLDIYCLISVNADAINQRGVGTFFGHLQQLAIVSITLSICKIYEEERGYELNSIRGVFRHLRKEEPTALDATKLKGFIEKYDGPLNVESPISALQLTIDGLRDRYRCELDRFKTFRDKQAAHSEYAINIDTLPSYDAMEKLFFFGADFYDLVSAAFVGVGPCDLRTQRPVKMGLGRLLQELGLEDVKTDIQ